MCRRPYSLPFSSRNTMTTPAHCKCPGGTVRGHSFPNSSAETFPFRRFAKIAATLSTAIAPMAAKDIRVIGRWGDHPFSKAGARKIAHVQLPVQTRWGSTRAPEGTPHQPGTRSACGGTTLYCSSRHAPFSQRTISGSPETQVMVNVSVSERFSVIVAMGDAQPFDFANRSARNI